MPAHRPAAALAFVALLALAAACWPPAAPAQGIRGTEVSTPLPGNELAGAALLGALRGGGYVIYFRHTATDFSRNDSRMSGFDDCANQRPLSERGRRDAARLGEQIRALRLPVGEVWASPMCRTAEHARLSFERFTPAPGLREAGPGDYPGLKELLARPVAPGSNRWLVGHGIPFRAVAGAPHLAEGEAAVVAPGADGWTVVARITVDGWAALAGSR